MNDRRGGGRGGGRYHILIKNIAFEVDWKKLKDIIKDEGIEPKFAQIVENRGRSAGFGFAAFHSESEMRQACQRLARKNV
jgi:RNA recognition motif-containing protein